MVKDKKQESIQWYINLIKSMGMFHRNTAELRKSGFGELTTNLQIGRYYFYFYDPKLKDTLPVYDKFPLCLPIDYGSDSFLGLNLHYLSPGARTTLHNRLLELVNDKNLGENAKIRASYDLLSSTQKYRMFKPCIKRYLYSHVQSKFLEISPDFWKMAIDLPVQQFRGAAPY